MRIEGKKFFYQPRLLKWILEHCEGVIYYRRQIESVKLVIEIGIIFNALL